MDSGIACIIDNEYGKKGFVTFEQLQRGRCKISFHLYDFEPHSVHAMHIHSRGNLLRGCKSLGPHYDPTASNLHGAFGSKIRHHRGDLLNNFQANESGSFEFVYVDSLKVKDLYGRSVVIHAFPDDLGRADYGTFPIQDLAAFCRERGYTERSRRAMIKKLNHESRTTGNASVRIACGIIGRG